MAETIELVKKRRRWPWVVLGSLVLLIGGPIAWRFRPLNANELRLVGPWKQSVHYEQFRLTPDRRFTIQEYGVSNLPDGTVTNSGSWYCRGDRLVMLPDETWGEFGRRVLGRRRFAYRYSGHLIWQSNDRFLLLVSTGSSFDPDEQTWHRRDAATERNVN